MQAETALQSVSVTDRPTDGSQAEYQPLSHLCVATKYCSAQIWEGGELRIRLPLSLPLVAGKGYTLQLRNSRSAKIERLSMQLPATQKLRCQEKQQPEGSRQPAASYQPSTPAASQHSAHRASAISTTLRTASAQRLALSALRRTLRGCQVGAQTAQTARGVYQLLTPARPWVPRFRALVGAGALDGTLCAGPRRARGERAGCGACCWSGGLMP